MGRRQLVSYPTGIEPGVGRKKRRFVLSCKKYLLKGDQTGYIKKKKMPLPKRESG